jgi:hypothetical protein
MPYFEKSLTLFGMEATVRGLYLPPIAGNRIDPPEGGYLEDVSIEINGVDFTDLFYHPELYHRLYFPKPGYRWIGDVVDEAILEAVKENTP